MLCSLITNFCENLRSWLERIHALAGGVCLKPTINRRPKKSVRQCLEPTFPGKPMGFHQFQSLRWTFKARGPETTRKSFFRRRANLAACSFASWISCWMYQPSGWIGPVENGNLNFPWNYQLNYILIYLTGELAFVHEELTLLRFCSSFTEGFDDRTVCRGWAQ